MVVFKSALHWIVSICIISCVTANVYASDPAFIVLCGLRYPVSADVTYSQSLYIRINCVDISTNEAFVVSKLLTSGDTL